VSKDAERHTDYPAPDPDPAPANFYLLGIFTNIRAQCNDTFQITQIKFSEIPRSVFCRSLNLKNSAGMDVAGVVEMTNLSRLRVPVSVDSHSLHLLKTLPRLPHLKALHLEFIAKVIPPN
jgi:hypothetical protein